MSTESSNDKRVVNIELTPSQQEQVFNEIGKKAESIELSPSELEERIAPRLNRYVY
jgi:hypothetical protein